MVMKAQPPVKLCRTHNVEGNAGEQSKGAWMVQGYPILLLKYEHHWIALAYNPLMGEYSSSRRHSTQSFDHVAASRWMLEAGVYTGDISDEDTIQCVEYDTRAQLIDTLTIALETTPFPFV